MEELKKTLEEVRERMRSIELEHAYLAGRADLLVTLIEKEEMKKRIKKPQKEMEPQKTEKEVKNVVNKISDVNETQKSCS